MLFFSLSDMLQDTNKALYMTLNKIFLINTLANGDVKWKEIFRFNDSVIILIFKGHKKGALFCSVIFDKVFLIMHLTS